MTKVQKDQKSVYFLFQKLNNLNLEFQLEDKESSSFLPLLENRMKQKGDTIELPGSGHHMQYYIDLHQEIYVQNVQNDQNKHCKTYPYGNFEIYNECDNKFIRKTLDDSGLTNFTPVWATDNMKEVNDLTDKRIPFISMDKMFSGVEPNECPKSWIGSCSIYGNYWKSIFKNLMF